MSLAEELLADLDEVGDELNEEELLQDNEEIMDAAAEELEDLVKMADKSVKAVAKLRDSKQVRKYNNSHIHVWSIFKSLYCA